MRQAPAHARQTQNSEIEQLQALREYLTIALIAPLLAVVPADRQVP